MKLPCETRMCFYRYSYENFLYNLAHMKILLQETTLKSVSTESQKLIHNALEVQYHQLFNPICELINKCQAYSTILADLTFLWLNLTLPEWKTKDFIEKRLNMSLTECALAAYALHPEYDDCKVDHPKKNFKIFIE